MAWEWAASWGRLTGTREWPADCAGQAARNQDGRGGGKLEDDDGKVYPEGGRTRGQGSLRYNATCGRSEGRDRGRHPCDARPLRRTPNGGGLGISPH